MSSGGMAIDDFMDESEDDEVCPTCIEPYDKQDKKFFPCPCNYRVCMFCVRRIQTEFDGRCPGCRRDYAEEDFRFEDAPESAWQTGSGRRKGVVRNEFTSSTRKGGKAAVYESGNAMGKPNNGRVTDRKRLANVRVIQRNLVYLIGLAPNVAREELLRKSEYFGQYGKIIKVVVKLGYMANQNRTASASAYITYSREEDARLAIMAVDNFLLEGHMIRASYGTTKYCNMFLRGLSCNNPDCLYLHKLGEDSASFTKEEMQSIGKNHFHDMTHIYSADSNGTPRKHTGILPPRGAVGSQWNSTSTNDETMPSVKTMPSTDTSQVNQAQAAPAAQPSSSTPAPSLPPNTGWAAVASNAPKHSLRSSINGITPATAVPPPGAPTNTLGAALTVAAKVPKSKALGSKKSTKHNSTGKQPTSKKVGSEAVQDKPLLVPTPTKQQSAAVSQTNQAAVANDNHTSLNFASLTTNLPPGIVPSPQVGAAAAAQSSPFLFSPASLNIGAAHTQTSAMLQHNRNLLGANLLNVPGTSTQNHSGDILSSQDSSLGGTSLLSSLGGMELSEYETKKKRSGNDVSSHSKSLAPGTGLVAPIGGRLAPGSYSSTHNNNLLNSRFSGQAQVGSMGLGGTKFGAGNIQAQALVQAQVQVQAQKQALAAAKEEWSRSMLAMPPTPSLNHLGERHNIAMPSGSTLHPLSRPGLANAPPGMNSASLARSGGASVSKVTNGLGSSGTNPSTRGVNGTGARQTLARPPPQPQMLLHQQRQQYPAGLGSVTSRLPSTNSDSAFLNVAMPPGMSIAAADDSALGNGAETTASKRRGVIGPVSEHVVSSAGDDRLNHRTLVRDGASLSGNRQSSGVPKNGETHTAMNLQQSGRGTKIPGRSSKGLRGGRISKSNGKGSGRGSHIQM